MNSGIGPNGQHGCNGANSPISLQDLQQAFSEHLLPVGSRPSAANIEGELIAGGIGPARRLHIYHHAYRMRLLDALRDSYGHTLLYLGDDSFNAAALACIETMPSTHPSLRNYGMGFPDFLKLQLPDEPEAAELALLDRTLRHTFDGPDAAVLTLADLAGIAAEHWAEVCLQLHPTCTRLSLHFNTLALWQAVDQEEDAPPPAPLQQPGELLVWRRGHQPHFRSLGALESQALTLLQAGTGFGALCAALAEQFPQQDTANEAGTLLRRWIDDELLTGITLPAAEDATAPPR